MLTSYIMARRYARQSLQWRYKTSLQAVSVQSFLSFQLSLFQTSNRPTPIMMYWFSLLAPFIRFFCSPLSLIVENYAKLISLSPLHAARGKKKKKKKKNRRAWSKKEMQSRMSCACAMKLASNTGSGEAVSEDFRSQTSSLFFFTRVLFSIDFLFLVELGACVRRINLGNLLLFSLAWSPVWKWNVCEFFSRSRHRTWHMRSA